MATETVVALNDTSDEKIDKVEEEVKPIEPGHLSPPGDEPNHKARESPLTKTEEKKIEELPNPAPSLPELEEKIEEKPIVAPVVEEVLNTDVKVDEKPEDTATEELPGLISSVPEVEEKIEENPIMAAVIEEVMKSDVKAEEKPEDKVNDELPGPVSSLPEIEEKIEEEPIVAPVTEKIVISDENPVLDDSVEEKLEVAKTPIPESDISDVTKTVVKDELKSSQDPILESDKSDAPEAVVKEKPAVSQDSVHELDSSDVLEAAADDVKLVEPVETEAEVQPTAESIDKEPVDQPKTAAVAELSSVKVTEKTEEPLEVSPAKEPESFVVEDKDNAASVKVEEQEHEATQEEKPQDQIQVDETLEVKSEVEAEGVTKEKIKEAAAPTEKVENTKEAEIIKDEEPFVSDVSDQVLSIKEEGLDAGKGVDTPATVEETVTESVAKEPDVTSVINELPKEAAVKPGKVEEDTSNNDGIEDKVVITDTPTEPTKVEDTAVDVKKNLIEGENTSRDVELVAENKDVNGEKSVSEGGNKNEAVEEKLTENVTALKEQVEEPQESKLEPKEEETIKEKGVETAKPDESNSDLSSKVEDVVSRDLPEEVQAKTTQKQSNSILTKVKKTLVKAKKAIIGKSPTPKAPSSETKGDIEVK